MPEPPVDPLPDEPSSALAEHLTGSLACLRCRYNLHGLSILSVCPECATPIRASILAVVDPEADAFTPLRRPRLTAAGVIAAAFAPLLIALSAWALRASEAADSLGYPLLSSARASLLSMLSVGGFLLGALGVLAFGETSAGAPARLTLRARLASACLLAAGGLLLIRPGTDHYLVPDAIVIRGIIVHTLYTSLLLASTLLLSAGVRALASRSILIRSGRVEAQDLFTLSASLGVVLAGDLLHLSASLWSGQTRAAIVVVGTAFIAGGSMLLTVGLVSLCADAVRLWRVILDPPPSPASLLRPQEGGA